MPTPSGAYTTQAERLAREQAVAWCAQMRPSAATAPDGAVSAAWGQAAPPPPAGGRTSKVAVLAKREDGAPAPPEQRAERAPPTGRRARPTHERHIGTSERFFVFFVVINP